MRTVIALAAFIVMGVIAVLISLASPAGAAETPAPPPSAPADAAKAASKPPASAQKSAPKTLEEITIEGEVRLPEVLFITSRDVERPLDWLEGYLNAEKGAAARSSDAPVRVHVVPAVGDSVAVPGEVGAQILFSIPASESAR